MHEVKGFRPFDKFGLFILPAIPMGILFICLILHENEGSLEGLEGLVGLGLLLWLLGTIVHRRHAGRNPYLNATQRSRAVNAVTFYGPLGQLSYFFSHVSKHDPDEGPPIPPPDEGRTLGDDYLNI